MSGKAKLRDRPNVNVHTHADDMCSDYVDVDADCVALSPTVNRFVVAPTNQLLHVIQANVHGRLYLN